MSIYGTAYPEYLDTMMEFRKKMESYPQGSAGYNEWREKIKQLRYYAIEENIDVYTLEYEARNLIHAEKYKVLIDEETVKIAENEAKLRELQKTPGDTTKQRVELENAINDSKVKINLHEQEALKGVTEEAKSFIHSMIQEAYLVKEMVDIRRQYDTATDEEKPVLAARAEQIRLEAIATLDSAGQIIARDDWERRVWLMYYGEDIAPPKNGNPDTRTDEQKALWASHKAIMDRAYTKYQGYDEKTKDSYVADDEMWEKIRQLEEPYLKEIWKERTYETFSGADMVVYFAFPGYKPIDIGVASLISYSLYREKKQIRTIGAINTRGITKGPRTISGRIVMTVVREHIVEMLRRQIPYMRVIKNMLMDELPPFDILVSFGNEYGAAATLVIHGVTLVDEQKTLTVEDLYTENIFTYLARDIDVMKSQFANYEDPYDPTEWMTSSFIPDGSEILGDFYPEELELTQAATLLQNPEPFYGAVSGWNAELYDLMYIGIDSGSLSIDDEGNLVNEDESKEEEKEPEKEEEKEDPADTYLWTTETAISKLIEKAMWIGGYKGINKETKKEQFEYYKDGALTSKKVNLVQQVRDGLSEYRPGALILTGKTNSNTTIPLAMYDAKTGKPSTKKFKVGIQWNVSPNSAVVLGKSKMDDPARQGTINWLDVTNHERNTLIRQSILGFWTYVVTFSDLKKAINTKANGSYSTAERRWLNTIDLTKIPKKENNLGHKNVTKVTVGETDMVFKSKFFARSGFLGTENGSIIEIGGDKKNVDLNDHLWFPTAIAPDGTRKIVTFKGLPKGASVFITFTYNITNPDDPYGDGVKKNFFMNLVRADWPNDNAFFDYVDTEKSVDKDRLYYYNLADFKK